MDPFFHGRNWSRFYPMDNHGKFLEASSFAFWGLGSSLPKSQELRSDQIHQLIRMITSIAKGRLWALFMCRVALSGFNHDGTKTPIWFQQFFAKGHVKKRWCSISSFWSKHNSQSYEFKFMFFLLSSPLVFSLFFRSQKNTLCFGWKVELQIQR